MSEDPVMEMYKAQAIVIEKQAVIDRLEKGERRNGREIEKTRTGK